MRYDKDVEVFHRDTLDDPTQCEKPWLVQYPDGTILEFDTEEFACAVQRAHRLVNGRNPETGELLVSHQRPCAVCGRVFEHVGEDNQPRGGIEFTTGGHYGSTVFDPCDGTRLMINICDVHIREWMELGRTCELR